MIGYTVLRKGIYQPFFLLPLPFLTYGMMQSFDRVYALPSSLLSLDRAAQLDQTSLVKIQFDEDLYRQPVLAEKKLGPLPYRTGTSPTARIGQRATLGIFNEDLGKMV